MCGSSKVQPPLHHAVGRVYLVCMYRHHLRSAGPLLHNNAGKNRFACYRLAILHNSKKERQGENYRQGRTQGCQPDKKWPLENNGGDEGGSSIAGQDGPEKQNSCQIVVVRQLVVVAHPPIEGHDDQRQCQLVHNAGPQEGDVPEVLGGTPLRNPPIYTFASKRYRVREFKFK